MYDNEIQQFRENKKVKTEMTVPRRCQPGSRDCRDASPFRSAHDCRTNPHPPRRQAHGRHWRGSARGGTDVPCPRPEPGADHGRQARRRVAIQDDGVLAQRAHGGRSDNINTVLSSPALAAMVTAPDAYTDRLIKTSDTITVPIRNLWVATGNNVQVSHEMARRCVLIRMDAKLEHPESGREFRHDPLMDWVRAHRGELVWAALVLVQAWVAKGRPRGTKSKGTFESWAKTISGIFEVCGMPGFLENKDELEAYSDSEEETWTAIIEAWWSTHGDKPVGSGDLLSIAVQHLSELGEAGQSRSTKWGVMLKSKRDTIISGKRIVSAGKNQGAAQWKLIYVNQERTSSEPRRSPQEETPSSQAGT